MDHHPSATKQAITRFLHAHRLPCVAIICYQLHDSPNTRWMYEVKVPAYFCHKVVHKKHVFLQVLPLEDEGYCVGHGINSVVEYTVIYFLMLSMIL